MTSSSRERILKMHSTAFVEHAGKGVDPEKQQELHNKIQSGEMPIGPKPDHSKPVQDIRPKYDGEEAYLLYRANRNGSYIGDGVLSELRELLDPLS